MSEQGLLRVGFARKGKQFDDVRLLRALREVGNVDNNQQVISGLRAAGGFLRSQLQGFIVQYYIGIRDWGRRIETSPDRTPSLYSSVRNTYKRGKEGSLRYVGFSRSLGEHGALAHLYDRGTGDRWVRKTGQYTGRMPRTDFMDRMISASGSGMLLRISRGVSLALRDAARKHGGY